MKRPVRKLVGTAALLVFFVGYVVLASAIGAGRITEASGLFQFAYFLIAGLIWIIPAGILIRWMVRPD